MVGTRNSPPHDAAALGARTSSIGISMAIPAEGSSM